MKCIYPWIDPNCLSDQLDGLVIISRLVGYDPKQMVGVCIFRISVQYLPINASSLLQIATLMEL